MASHSATLPPPVASLPLSSILTSLTSSTSLENGKEKGEEEEPRMLSLPKVTSLFPLLSCPQVPDDAFNAFHTIDRELFTVLIRKLHRDPAESMQVVAFFIWLERQVANNSKLVKRLCSLAPELLNDVCEEAICCLNCADSDQVSNPGREIKLLQGLMESHVIKLNYFHENRVSVTKGVMQIANTVCKRAFRDIVERLVQENAAESSRMAAERRSREAVPLVARVPPPALMLSPYMNGPFVQLPPPGPGTGGFIQVLHQRPVQVVTRPVVAHAIGIPVHVGAVEGYPFYGPGPGQMMENNELGAMREQGEFVGGNREEIANVEDEIRVGVEEIPPEERTIFLTFSKGYPISEEEVCVFFTRKFGDFIEEIVMQEVEEGEQVLYARMICKNPDVIDNICRGSKAKYSINGKHVWARKYVKKQLTTRSSPPRAGEASTSQQFPMRE